MENDSIRASGNNTLVDVWVEGKLRAICITREAIEASGGFECGLSEESRCEFVQSHLARIVTSVKAKLREGNAGADAIIINAGQISSASDARKSERRKGERRDAKRAAGNPPESERRGGERRGKDRRRAAKKPS